MDITICIGRPTIDKVARGEPVEVGHGVAILAADDLFHASPYAEIERLRAALETARRQLVTLGGGHLTESRFFGDDIQRAVLTEIDTALAL